MNLLIRPLLSILTFNNMMRMIAGKRYFGVEDEDNEEVREFRDLLKDVFKFTGVANPGDFMPLLRWIDYKSFEKNLCAIKIDAFLQRLIEEHRSKKGGTPCLTTCFLCRCLSLKSTVILSSNPSCW